LKKLDRGELLGVFPEGTRSVDGKIKRGKLGVGMFAFRSEVPVVPVAIIGSDKILPKGKLVPRVSSVEIKVGEPVDIEKYFPEPPQTRDEEKRRYQEIVDLIIYKIAKLKGDRIPDGIDVSFFDKIEKEMESGKGE